jgi:hypothetical protein
MSYARFGWNSDIYLIGVTDNGKDVIECCGCLLLKRGPWPGPDPEPTVLGQGGFEWVLEPFPHFSDNDELLRHLALHMSAGHKIPEDVYSITWQN